MVDCPLTFPAFRRFLLLALSVLFLHCLLFISCGTLSAQSTDWDPNAGLTHWMTPEEELLKGEIGKDFISMLPPDGPVRNVAEFDKMQAIMQFR